MMTAAGAGANAIFVPEVKLLEESTFADVRRKARRRRI
jgi:hypothetical protein